MVRDELAQRAIHSADRPPGRVEASALVALGACAATALFLVPVGVSGPGYFPVLRLHVVAGLVSLVLFLPAVLLHLRRHPDRRGGRALLEVGGAALLGAGVLLAFDWVDDVGAEELATLLVWSGLATLLMRLAAGRWIGSERHGGGRTGALLVVVAAGALLSGWVVWRLRGDALFPIQHAHSMLGIGLCALVAAHSFWARRRAVPLGLRRRLATTLLILGAGAVWLGATLMRSVLPSLPLGIYLFDDVWAVPASAAERATPPPQPFRDALWTDSASCGDSGCHPAITRQWEGSAHRFAADNDLYRHVVGLLVAERGPAEAVFCANCHDPARVLAGTVVADYAEGAAPVGEGVSCVVCHSSVGLAHDRDPANGLFLYRAPFRYPGASAEERNANIRLDPRRHRASFEVRDHSTGASMCGACHRVEVDHDVGAAVEAVVQSAVQWPEDGVADCNHCHMPPTTPVSGQGSVLGVRSPPLYDHRMAAMNVDLPRYAFGGDGAEETLAESAAAAERFQEGRLGHWLGPEGGTDYEQDAFVRALDQTFNGGPVLRLDVQARLDGRRLEVTVSSRNERAGHPFPIGPFDLQQTWQELTVRDAGGRVVATVGAEDADGAIDPRAHRLGAEEWQRDGQPLQGHRIWDLAAITNRRQVPAGGAVSDGYAVDLPEDASGPFEVEVGWNHRRVNPEFSAAVYGPAAPRFPTRRLVTERVRAGVPR